MRACYDPDLNEVPFFAFLGNVSGKCTHLETSEDESGRWNARITLQVECMALHVCGLVVTGHVAAPNKLFGAGS